LALNNPDAGSILRKPRAKLFANGAEIANWSSIEVVNNRGNFSSDSFEAEFPLYGQPPEFGFAYWSTQTDIEIEIWAGFVQPDGSLGSSATLIVGLVDEVGIEPIDGTFRIRGRDYSGALIDSIASETSLNVTASTVASRIAAEHGLAANVTRTATPIARYYGDGNYGARLTRQQSEWDFLTQLAQQEGFLVTMMGRTLYFGPPPTPDTDNPYVIKLAPASSGRPLASNAKTVKLTRALTVARDVDVFVLSANRSLGKTIQGHFHAVNSLRAGRSGAKAPPQVYTFRIPNLTQAQANQKAEALAKQITQQERIVEATLPGDTALAPLSTLKLVGTGTDFDQTYYQDRVTHRIDISSGYRMDLRAKNHSSYSTVPQ
jgi:phage protein D